MRIIRTYILRLLVDSEHPEEINGALQAADQETPVYPFRDEAALLALLRRQAAAGITASRKKPDKKGEPT